MKISKHFTTSPLTAGLSISALGSVWLYGAWIGLDFPLLNTVTGLLFFYLLLQSNPRAWFWSGFFIGLLWFWWIGVSFLYYHMSWAIPLVIFGVGLVYGGILWGIATIASHTDRFTTKYNTLTNIPYTLFLKASGLLVISYLHPLGFDWFKPELLFVHTYLGVTKWQFALVMIAIVLAQWRRNLFYLGLVVFAYSPIYTTVLPNDPTHTIKLVSTHTTIADKWDPAKSPKHIKQALHAIDQAIQKNYKVVILPESIFPFFLNHRPKPLGQLLKRSQEIDIIIGALYLDGYVHRNSTYHFHQGRYIVANKVLLVPFGEANPLPEWAGKWINKFFFDGAVDYIASADPTDWEINGTKYRNAICYEATSERLYEGYPTHMIVISNNAWFSPSNEPTFQRLLLEYYTRKYGTTIYHATNMSPPHIIKATP